MLSGSGVVLRLVQVFHFHLSWAESRRYSRRDLNHSVIHVEHGKPVLLPSGQPGRKAWRKQCG